MRIDHTRALPALSLVLAALMAAALLLIGPTHTVLAPWDFVIHLDESWRLYSGQHQHTDFHNPVGAFAYWLSAIGMHMVGPSSYGVVIGNVILLIIAALSATFVAYRRLPRWEALAFTVLIILMASAMTQIGRPATLVGYVEVYNRYSWTLSCVLFLQVLFPLRSGAPARPIAEGLIAAALVSVIVYTKVSFGFVALVAVIVGAVLSGVWRERRYVGALLAGGLVCIALAWLVMGVNIFAYANDVLHAAGGQTLERRGRTIINVFKNIPLGVAMLGAVWVLLVVLPVRAKTLAMPDAVRITAIAAFIGVCGLLIAFANTGENGEVPLFILIGLFVLNAMRPAHGAGRDWKRLAATAVVAFGLAAPIMVRDAASIAIAASTKQYRTATLPASQRFDAGPLRDFVIPHTTDWVTEYWLSAQLPERVNDGLALMRNEVPPGDTIFTLAFSNIFPFALGQPSPQSAQIWFEYGLNFNEEDHPPAEALFADADYVAIPIISETDQYRGGKKTVDALLAAYGPYLAEHYSEAGRSTYWILLRRVV